MTSLTHRTPSRATFAVALAFASFAGVGGGCDDTDSATNLYLVGPPMVEQVRLVSASTDAQGIVHRTTVFGFGTHPDAQPTDEPTPVTVAATNQKFRIIMDHLLVGNYLENIACNTAVEPSGSHFQFVPVGDTPDDIAKCAVAPDVLKSTCTGPKAVCVCDIPAGCNETLNGSAVSFKMGDSVGILDANLDGASDLHQFRENAVGISCGSDLSIKVPIDLNASYWYPSGDQQVPATGGFDALGPAIVLVPQGPLPANVACQVVFSNDVVDKAGSNVCIPENGDVLTPCTPSRTAADTANWKIQMEPLTVSLSNPTNGGTLNRTDSIIITSSDTIPLDPASVQNITLTENGVPYTQITIALDMSGADVTITSTAAGGFDPNATYMLTVPTTVTDTYGQPITTPLTATFTTGA